MENKVGQVPFISLGVSESCVVCLGASIDRTRDGEKLRHLIAMSEHAPIVESAGNSAIAIAKRVLIAYPKVDYDCPENWMNEGVSSVQRAIFCELQQ